MPENTPDNFLGTFEEFEFKPLTEGLGFNKKAENLKGSSAQSPSAPAPSRSSIFPSSSQSSSQSQSQSSAASSSSSSTSRAAGASSASTFDSAASRSAFDPAGERSTSSSSFGAGATSSAFGNFGAGAGAQSDSATSQSISELMAALPPSLDFLDDKQDLTRKTERPQIFQPIACEEYRTPPPVVSGGLSTGPTVGSVLPAPGTKAGRASAAMGAGTLGAPLASGTMSAKALSPNAPSMPSTLGRVAPTGYRERMTEAFAKAFPTDTAAKEKIDAQVEDLRPATVNFSAALIDGMVVAGIATILLVCIITITHVNLVAMLSNSATDSTTIKNMVFLFLAVLQMYMLVSRAFFGASLGEWAFELQLGTTEQQRSVYYPLQVLLRTFVTTITGLLALPLLSFAFRRDLGRYVSGTQLYRRV